METSTLGLLRAVPIFADLPPQLLQEVACHSRRRFFGAQETLFCEGEPGYTLYIVISGFVTIQSRSASGTIISLAQRGPGEYFGELSLIDGKPRMADAVTAICSELLMLHRPEFLTCLKASPQMSLNILSNLADRLREAARDVENRQELDVLGRVAGELLKLVAAHGIDHPSGGRLIAVKLTQTQLAHRVGTTRESVNRAFVHLKKGGALHTKGRNWIVLSEEKLCRCLK